MVTNSGKDARLFKTVEHALFAIIRVGLPTLHANGILISLRSSSLSLDVLNDPFFTFYLDYFLP